MLAHHSLSLVPAAAVVVGGRCGCAGYGRMAIAKLLADVVGGAALLEAENDSKQKPVDVAKVNGEVGLGFRV